MKKLIRFLLVLVIGCALMYLSLRKLELSELLNKIHGANLIVVIPVFVISIVGYWIRSLRWGIILKAMEQPVHTFHLFSSLSAGYAVNIATPRLGEIARCVVLNRTDDIPIEQSFISVVVERVVDFICLISVLLMATLMSYGEVRLFISSNIVNPMLLKWKMLPLGWIVTGTVAVIIFTYVLFVKMRESNRIKQFIERLLESVKQVLHLEQRILFFVYTLTIWACYFLMTYLWFNMFEETAALGLKEALVIMAIGSVGRSVPVHGGGMGAYHFLVSNAFTLFGVSLLMGTAMSIIIHGAQILLTFVLGVGCWIWMLIYIRQKNEE